MTTTTTSGGAVKQLMLLTAVVVIMMVILSLQQSSSPSSSFSSSLSSSSHRSGASTTAAARRRQALGSSSSSSSTYTPRYRRHFGKCKWTAPQPAQHRVSTTFVASYPGSGSATVLALSEALTGLSGSDEYHGQATENWVVLDTHYPCYHGRRVEGFDSVQRSILLLRNPLHAMPDYYRYLCSIDASLQRAAEESAQTAWFVWRDASFEGQIQVWRKHAEYWMDEFHADRQFVTSYERLLENAHSEQGAYEALRLAKFLSKSQGVTTKPTSQIPCQWHKVVAAASSSRAVGVGVGVAHGPAAAPTLDEESESSLSQRRQLQQSATPDHGGNFVPSYQPQQLKDTMLILSQLLERYRDERSIAPILVDYLDNVGLRGPQE